MAQKGAGLAKVARKARLIVFRRGALFGSPVFFRDWTERKTSVWCQAMRTKAMHGGATVEFNAHGPTFGSGAAETVAAG
ncbi:UNVERIFIED_CONTAM: hypothetical protein Sradi_6867900 [Sesamum radiatum]|uniref:Uncharacterized protein n=1 Tax=Sesamum radiatum TaxID=300843 RepID=A0AAW2JJZ4_SESRA